MSKHDSATKTIRGLELEGLILRAVWHVDGDCSCDVPTEDDGGSMCLFINY